MRSLVPARQVECSAMPKVGIALVVLLGWVAAADSTLSQPTAGFSGHWLLRAVSPQRRGYDQFWLATEATISLDASSLIITRVSPPPQREARFTLDRTESHNEYDVGGRRVVRDSR